jgi:hypothetical protein
MSELKTLRQGVRLGKHVMQKQIIELFESMKSNDPTDTDYSIANVLTIAEAIEAVKKAGN